MHTHLRNWCVPVIGAVLAAAWLVWTMPTTAAPAPDQAPKKEEPKKEEPRKQAVPDFPFPDLEKLLPPGSVDAEQLKELKQMMDELNKQMLQQFRGVQRGNLPGIVLPGRMGRNGFNPFGGDLENGRFGASIEQPSDTIVNQLNLPEKQGIVIKEVKADSAAAKAGIKDHDILLELNGKPVSSDMDEFQKQLKDIKPDAAVDAVVLRKGKKETIKGLKLPEAKEEPNNPFRGFQPFQQIFPQGIPGLPGVPGLPGLPGVPPQGNAMAIQKNADGSYTATMEQNGAKFVVNGSKNQVATIEITSGTETKTYKSVDEVPEAQRDAVKKLIRAGEGGRGINFNFRNFP